jgi:hypothetical protein
MTAVLGSSGAPSTPLVRAVLRDGRLEAVADVLGVARVHALHEEGVGLSVGAPLLGLDGEPGKGPDGRDVVLVYAFGVFEGLVHVLYGTA